MYQFLSKAEDKFSQAIEQAAKEVFYYNIHHHDTRKKLIRLAKAVENVLFGKQFAIYCQN